MAFKSSETEGKALLTRIEPDLVAATKRDYLGKPIAASWSPLNDKPCILMDVSKDMLLILADIEMVQFSPRGKFFASGSEWEIYEDDETSLTEIRKLVRGPGWKIQTRASL